MGGEKVKIKSYDEATDMSVGFVVIEDLGNAQQVTINTEKLRQILRIITSMEKLGFTEVTITVERGYPLVIGGKKIGIAIVPVYEGGG